MNVDWVLDPVVLTVVMGVGLMGSLALWISEKIEARAAQKTFADFRVSTEAAIQDLSARIEEMRTAPVSEPPPSPVMSVQGMNLTTRTKVLRMHRRGETIPGIAAALGVQQEEVDLLVKLDRLLDGSVAVCARVGQISDLPTR
jgi:hypothetical protein